MSKEVDDTQSAPGSDGIQDKPGLSTPTQAKMVPPPIPPEEFFVDGVSGLTARGGVFKIDLYKVVGIEDNTELRTISYRLILPTLAMNELDELLRQAREVAKKASEAGAASKS